MENFNWYVQNLGILLSLYPDKYIIICDRQIVASCDSFQEAIDTSLTRGLQNGKFNIQYCGDMNSHKQVLNPFHLETT